MDFDHFFREKLWRYNRTERPLGNTRTKNVEVIDLCACCGGGGRVLKHNKDEEIKRRGIWEANVIYINQHNAKYNKGEETFFLGQNECADMTNEEYKKLFLGYQMHNDTDGNDDFYTDEDVSALPYRIDWRAFGYVTDVKRQKMCASSYAFAAAGAIEGQMFRRTGSSQSLSAQNIIDCASKCMGCLGGCTIRAFQYVADNKGISTESGYPYQATKLRQCMYSKCNYGGTCSGYRKVKRYSEHALQSAVANVGPVAVGIDASHITFQLYLGGVYHNPLCSKVLVNHAALVTGYGALRSGSYWLVKNRSPSGSNHSPVGSIDEQPQPSTSAVRESPRRAITAGSQPRPAIPQHLENRCDHRHPSCHGVRTCGGHNQKLDPNTIKILCALMENMMTLAKDEHRRGFPKIS
ncbi:hypothetical protein RRG08_054134 [Elysia crispata]|uniref:Uncharacterized protein n=1 Tax=Elysia crispata TaxID=231223 RepID=A0AAE0Y7L5_9GAST|nr:hypothetical protein RRG08_054134 [Elysia crispata]